MANTYSFEKLIQLLSQNFDVKIIDYNEKKFITFGRDIYKDSREIDKRKEFTIIKSQYFYRFISSTMVDGYLVERNQETFSTVGEIYKFILKKINDLKSNTYIKQTSIESLNIDSRDLDNEFTSRLTLLKLIGKYDDFIKAIEKEIMVGAVGQIQFSNNNKDAKINVTASTNKDVVYLGNNFTLTVETDFKQDVVSSKTVYDTQFFDDKMGIKISIYDNNKYLLYNTEIKATYYTFDTYPKKTKNKERSK